MRSALGKGLNALISDETVASVSASAAPSPAPLPAAANPSTLPIAKIFPNPKQPRRQFDPTALAELAASIREKGILQPILVTPTSEGNFEIVAGERRWRAAQTAGLVEIPAYVKQGSESERFQWALVENIQRQDLNPMEQARGFKRLQDEFSMTQEQIAQAVGKDRAVVANTLRLLQLSSGISDAIIDGRLSAGHARSLLAVEDPIAREALFQRILTEQLTVRDVEKAARVHKSRPLPPPAAPAKPADVKALEEDLQHSLGRKVEFQTTNASSHSGWIKLEFYSLNDLDVLISQLKKNAQP
jgi:ParB family transcriptional regulator, chromosome partitioning protein